MDYIANGYEKLIAPLWDDLGGSGGTASYKLEGSTNNHVLTVEWLNWRWRYQASAAGISFQVKLFEADDKIQFVYREEAGILYDPSASIGLTGSTGNAFYSLDNTSASPTFSISGNNLLNSKPASGQIYTFTPSVAVVSAPTVQASSILVPSPTSSGMNISWTNGNGAYRVVFVKQTSSTVETVPVANNSYYNPSTTYGSGSSVSGWYCIYNGTGNSVAITNLQSTLNYRIQVLEYNGYGGNQKYATSTSTNNPFNAATALGPPVGPITDLTKGREGITEATFNIFKGNGAKRAIFIKEGISGTANPIDNTTYTANTNFTSGTQIGSTGWYCVYNGEGVFDYKVRITGLTPNTSYRIHAVDYNGSAGLEKYFVSTVSDNPIQITTLNSIPVSPPYTLTPSSGTFTPLTGGTALDNIESDDALSLPLPLGFTFKYAGTNYTQLRACSNGFLSLNPFANNNLFDNDNNFTDSELRPLIAPLWDDLSGSGGEASYTTAGNAPNRVFIMQFLNWKWNYGAANAGISFQVKLYETSNKIEFIYRPEVGAFNSPSASVGLVFPDINQADPFMSLSGLGSNPSVSTVTENDVISLKPASGQIYTFTPNKLSQTITGFTALPVKTFGDASFTLPAAVASSGLTVSFTSSNTSVATISGNTVTIVGGGSTTITANQSGDADYAAAAGVQQTLTVNKKAQTITFNGPLTNRPAGDSFNPGATSNSGLAVSYTSSNTAVATVSGTTVTAVGVGTTTITANQAGNDNYLPASGVGLSFTVVKGNQTITFNAIPNQEYRETKFTLTATTPSGLTILYSSSNPAVATITGNQLTFEGLGNTTITASQAGDANYNAATPVDRSLTVVKGSQSITFDPLPTKDLNALNFTLNATSASGLAITYTSSNTSVATVDGNIVDVIGIGSTDITASQAGNALYNAATNVVRSLQVVSSIAEQTITFDALAARKFGDAPFDLTATASSGLSVEYTSSNTSIATISGSTVTIVGAGFADITASQGGNNEFADAPNVTQRLTINKKAQVITFDVVTDKTFSQGGTFDLSATSNSPSPILFSTPSTTGFISNGNKVLMSIPGPIVLKAYQIAGDNYEYGEAVQTICLNPPKPTINLEMSAGVAILNSINPFGGDQWFKDGVEISGAINQSYLPTEPGNYTVRTKIGNCESAMSNARSIVITALEDVASLITVSPNPSQKEIRIDLTSLGKGVSANIEIHDLLGRTFHSSIGTGIVLIDIADYQKGNYILGIKSGSKTVTKQIAKN